MYKEFDIGEAIVGTPYRVVGLIGQGGMGSVYEVEHRELGKRFVLKALLSELVTRNDLVQRLRNEWRALGKLEHPNIVSVTDAGVTEAGVPFYVMERLYGITLGERLRNSGALPMEEACSIAAEILEGLSAAHAIGVVHRDVKPPNIFLTKAGTAKILDFGIAKVLGGNASITARGYAIGTPRYMSPEQASGGAVDARADLYAVGLLLFEMLVGASPFEGCDSKEVFMAHILKPAPMLAECVPGVPSELNHLVARLLQKKPEDRPNSARGVAGALRAVVRMLCAASGETNTVAQPLSDALTPLADAAAPSTRRGGAARVEVDAGASGHGPTQSRPSYSGRTPLVRFRGAATEALSHLDAQLPVTRTAAPAPKTPPPVSSSAPPWGVSEPTPPHRPASVTGIAVAAGVIGAVLSVVGVWALVPRGEPNPSAAAAETRAALAAADEPKPVAKRVEESPMTGQDRRSGATEPGAPAAPEVAVVPDDEPVKATRPAAESPASNSEISLSAIVKEAKGEVPTRPEVATVGAAPNSGTVATPQPSNPTGQASAVEPVTPRPPEAETPRDEPPQRRLPGSGIPGF